MGVHVPQCAWWCVCVVMFAFVSSTSAQSERLVVRASVDAATMISRDQLNHLAYDRVGLFGGAQLGYGILSRLDLQLGAVGGAFLSSSKKSGGLVSPTVGLVVHALRDDLSPYAFVDAGAGFTGALRRPFFRLGVGLDIPITHRLALGPAAGYGHLVQNEQRQGSSTDARYIWAGLSLLYRHISPRAAPAAITRHERVVVIKRVREPALVTSPQEVPTGELLALLDKALPNPPASRVELLAPVLFAYDSDQLEPVGVAMLHEVARELQARPDILLVSIQGYADRRGGPEYNRELSRKRAERVLSWLIEHGIEPIRLQLEAEGATGFVEPGATEPDHEQNRRVVFRVLKTDDPR